VPLQEREHHAVGEDIMKSRVEPGLIRLFAKLDPAILDQPVEDPGLELVELIANRWSKRQGGRYKRQSLGAPSRSKRHLLPLLDPADEVSEVTQLL
jgi:hypothetical protein